MFSKMVKRAASLGALLIVFVVAASAQTGSIEGTVKLKNADGTITPVAGAVIDIYRLDIKGHWDTKTDKNGHYVRIGLPIQGTFMIVASGPGARPTWNNNVRLAQVPVMNFTLDPGDGTKPTLEQIQAAMKGTPAGPAQPTTRQPSAEDRAKAEDAKKEYEAKVKEHQSLQAALDEAIKHFNAGHEMRQANNLEGAITEFKAASNVDPAKEKAFLEVAYKAHASLAETHYIMGADIFNKAKKPVPEAKPHFEEAVKEINTAIAIAQTDTTNANINNELILYYNILAKSVKPLVQFYSQADALDTAAKAFEKAEAIDAPNKTKWLLAKGELFRLGFKLDDAVAIFKQVLAADPNNVDAMYGIGLALVYSGEKDKLQDAANFLADFVSKAPATDPRVPEVNQSLVALKNEFKIEAEKPAKRGRKP